MIEKRGKVTESIYSGSSIIPLADVSHIEKRGVGNLMVVLAGTTWCKEMDEYHNAVFISASEADQFKKAWCDYRAELERDSLMDISPKAANEHHALVEESERLREFIKMISEQEPEKPNHWASCSQCERNEAEAVDILETIEALKGSAK